MKKTAVEWLADFFESGVSSVEEWTQAKEQAKAMEKEQIHNIRQMLIEGALTNMSCSSAIVEFDKLTK